jgi:hypothetical protein
MTHKEMNFSTSILNTYSKYFFSFTLVIFLFSQCKDSDTSGFKTPPIGEEYNFTFADTFTVQMKTILEDSLRSDEFTDDLLGFYQDNTVGKVKASVFAELRLPGNEVDFGTSPVFNSAILQINYSQSERYFGDVSDVQTFNVYEITQRIYQDSDYYAHDLIQYDMTPIGSFSNSFNPDDSGYINIPIDQVFAERILNGTVEQLNNDEDFLEMVNGIAIIPEEHSSKGAIISFQLENENSLLRISYNDSLHHDFLFDANSARISHFEHDYTGTPIENQLQNPSFTAHDQVFIQPLDGVKLKVKIPYLKELVKDSSVALQKAEISFYVDQTSSYIDDLPGALLLLNSDKYDNNTGIDDRLDYSYGGTLSDDETEYRFVITKHMQNLLLEYRKNQNYSKDYGLNLIVPSDNPIIANPLILLNKHTNGSQAVTLRLYFTKL